MKDVSEKFHYLPFYRGIYFPFIFEKAEIGLYFLLFQKKKGV